MIIRPPHTFPRKSICNWASLPKREASQFFGVLQLPKAFNRKLPWSKERARLGSEYALEVLAATPPAAEGALRLNELLRPEPPEKNNGQNFKMLHFDLRGIVNWIIY